MVSVPMATSPMKKSTLVTEPLVPAAAVAVIVKGEPTNRVPPVIGAVIEMLGSEIAPTVTLMPAEVAMLPRLSVTSAVMVCRPAGAAVHETA